MSNPAPIDPEKVQSLAAAGVTDADIAAFLMVTVSALRRRFKVRLRSGRAQRRIAIRQAQNKAALVDGNAAMLTWLGKNELGQTQKPAGDFPPEPRLGPKVG